MKSDTKNYIDLLRAYGQNSEGLHCAVQKQLAGLKPGGGRGIKKFFKRHNVMIEE